MSVRWHPNTGFYALAAKVLQRRFVKSTGLTLGKWRQSMRLMRSIQWLLQGRLMTHAALESGYDSLSAYSVAFKKQFGYPPSRFVESLSYTLDVADPMPLRQSLEAWLRRQTRYPLRPIWPLASALYGRKRAVQCEIWPAH